MVSFIALRSVATESRPPSRANSLRKRAWASSAVVPPPAGFGLALAKAAALRPARAVLSTEKLFRATGFRFPPWRDSVRAYLAAI
jgi:dTDP-4-dehydrorhamnose reductase